MTKEWSQTYDFKSRALGEDSSRRIRFSFLGAQKKDLDIPEHEIVFSVTIDGEQEEPHRPHAGHFNQKVFEKLVELFGTIATNTGYEHEGLQNIFIEIGSIYDKGNYFSAVYVFVLSSPIWVEPCLPPVDLVKEVGTLYCSYFRPEGYEGALPVGEKLYYPNGLVFSRCYEHFHDNLFFRGSYCYKKNGYEFAKKIIKNRDKKNANRNLSTGKIPGIKDFVRNVIYVTGCEHAYRINISNRGHLHTVKTAIFFMDVLKLWLKGKSPEKKKEIIRIVMYPFTWSKEKNRHCGISRTIISWSKRKVNENDDEAVKLLVKFAKGIRRIGKGLKDDQAA